MSKEPAGSKPRFGAVAFTDPQCAECKYTSPFMEVGCCEGHNHCTLKVEDISADYRVKARHDARNMINTVRFRMKGPPGGFMQEARLNAPEEDMAASQAPDSDGGTQGGRNSHKEEKKSMKELIADSTDDDELLEIITDRIMESVQRCLDAPDRPGQVKMFTHPTQP